MSPRKPREDGDAPELDPQEKAKADEEQSITVDVTHEVIRREGEKELRRTGRALFWSGLAAGLAMSFSLMTEALLFAALPDSSWRPLVTKLGYPVGFLAVIMSSQQLYTENTLLPVIPVMHHRSRDMLGRMLRLWVIVLAANLLGAALMGWVLARTSVLPSDARAAIITIGRDMIGPDLWSSGLRAVVAGWIIAAMVWMLPAAQSAHVSVIFVMTYLIGIAKLPHVIAGSVTVFSMVWGNELGLGVALREFVLPALIGNTVGGVVLVAVLNHAQVVAGARSRRA